MSRASFVTRLTGSGFAIGAVAHAVQAVVAAANGLPSWRHSQMALVDTVIALVAFRYPRVLVFCLFGFLVEQLITHGAWVQDEWTMYHHVPWLLVVVDALVLVAMIGAGFFRWRSQPRAAHRGP